jgi:hypothetical protein
MHPPTSWSGERSASVRENRVLDVQSLYVAALETPRRRQQLQRRDGEAKRGQHLRSGEIR